MKTQDEILKESLVELLDGFRLRSILDALSSICFERGKGEGWERPDLWMDAGYAIDRAVMQIANPENSNTDENE